MFRYVKSFWVCFIRIQGGFSIIIKSKNFLIIIELRALQRCVAIWRELSRAFPSIYMPTAADNYRIWSICHSVLLHLTPTPVTRVCRFSLSTSCVE